MWIVMYADRMKACGLDEKEWDVMTYITENLVNVDVPDEILKEYYGSEIKEDYDNIPFEQWYYEESIADDMDGLFEFTDWRPFLADVEFPWTVEMWMKEKE